MTTQDNQTKVLLFAPLAFAPFLALLFWALGGGTAAAQDKTVKAVARINTNLPGAAIKGKDADMLSLYDQADKDSARRMELRAIEARDWHLHNGYDTVAALAIKPSGSSGLNPNFDHRPEDGRAGTTPDALERRLAQLQTQLSAARETAPVEAVPAPVVSHVSADTDQEHLQQMMEQLSSTGSDPEITQLNTLLDKVIAIQHPEAALDSIRQPARKDSVHRVITTAAITQATTNRFYGFTGQTPDTVAKNTIAAQVYQDQVVTSGSNVTLMLTEEMRVAGYRIPKGNFITGHCSITGGRVHINITGIIVGSTILGVNLSAFDLDGQEGINAPNSALRDESREGGASMVGDLGLTSVDQSVAAQATSAGIQTARSFLSKRIKVVKVPLYAGYRLLLKNK